MQLHLDLISLDHRINGLVLLLALVFAMCFVSAISKMSNVSLLVALLMFRLLSSFNVFHSLVKPAQFAIRSNGQVPCVLCVVLSTICVTDYICCCGGFESTLCIVCCVEHYLRHRLHLLLWWF